MLIPNKFNGYFAGRRTCYEGGGGGDGGSGGQGPGDGPAGAEGMDGIGISGVNDGGFSGSGGDGAYDYGSLFESKRPEALPYTAQNLPTANTAIYKPTYSDYAAPSFDAVGTYGQDFQPYFSRGLGSTGGVNYGMPYNGGIADLYANPSYFSNYGIAGLYR